MKPKNKGIAKEQGYSSEVERLRCSEEAQTPGPKPNKQAKPHMFPLLSRFGTLTKTDRNVDFSRYHQFLLVSIGALISYITFYRFWNTHLPSWFFLKAIVPIRSYSSTTLSSLSVSAQGAEILIGIAVDIIASVQKSNWFCTFISYPNAFLNWMFSNYHLLLPTHRGTVLDTVEHTEMV